MQQKGFMKIILKNLLHKIRDLFPIHPGEYAKFYLLAGLAFLVCTNYTLLRTLKETLVITQPEMGIKAVPFLRTWMLMPIMLIFVKAYAVLSVRFSQQKVCYIFLSFFFSFFVLFTFAFYPFQEAFHLTSLGHWISACNFPFAAQLGGLIKFWSFSVYYCLSEVWGTLVVLILFWGVSNRINTLEEAKRFYSPILLVTNLSGFFASQISLYFSNSSFKYFLFPGKDRWSATLLSITLFACIVVLLIMCLFRALFKMFDCNNFEKKKNDLSKKEMSLIKIIQSVGKKEIFFSLSIMVFSYFFASGILDYVWKYYLQQLYPDSNDFNDYLSRCTTYISIGSTLLALFITGDLIRSFSWRISAMVPPALLLLPVMGLLIVYFCFNADPVLFSFFGASYYCLNRICKFTFFDLSKEIATMELSFTEQIKSKTILDGLIPKFAKTSESIVIQLFLLFLTSFSTAIPSILIVMVILHLAWALATREKQKEHIVEANL